jgi:NAD(P)-dependent dehydrogenase (short-subunit alcohol dehydrogenase family)
LERRGGRLTVANGLRIIRPLFFALVLIGIVRAASNTVPTEYSSNRLLLHDFTFHRSKNAQQRILSDSFTLNFDEKFYDLHFDANVKGMFFAVQKALPLMNDGSAIILTGSIADVKGFPSISVYSATKAAVCSFARTWTTELKDRHIRLNTISPGHIDTPIFDTWQQGDALAKMKDYLAKNVPLGRLGDPDEIAKAVSFLASDEASYVAGVELYVDGSIAQI